MQAALALCPLLTYSDTTNEKLFGKINLPAVCSDRRTNDRCDDVENELQGYYTASGPRRRWKETNAKWNNTSNGGRKLVRWCFNRRRSPSPKRSTAQCSGEMCHRSHRCAVTVCLAGVDPPGLMSQYLCKFQQVLFFLSKESSVECV